MALPGKEKDSGLGIAAAAEIRKRQVLAAAMLIRERKRTAAALF